MRVAIQVDPTTQRRKRSQSTWFGVFGALLAALVVCSGFAIGEASANSSRIVAGAAAGTAAQEHLETIAARSTVRNVLLDRKRGDHRATVKVKAKVKVALTHSKARYVAAGQSRVTRGATRQEPKRAERVARKRAKAVALRRANAKSVRKVTRKAASAPVPAPAPAPESPHPPTAKPPITPTAPSTSSPAQTDPGPIPTPATPQTAFGLNVWTLEDLALAEAQLGSSAAIVGVFADWARNPDFPSAIAKQVAAKQGTLLVAWEPWDSWESSLQQSAFQLSDILAGDYDSYIKRWAEQIRDFSAPVLVRYAPEMNGDWRPWSPGVNGATASDYVASWRHVHGLFAEAGAHNVRWVWNPIVESGGATPMADLYPGHDFVDWVALDGFNWGSTKPWGWQSYDDIFAPSVRLLDEIAPNHPWMIAETGSAPGVAKPEWITNTLSSAQADGAGAVVWFEFDKETDWRLTADAQTAAAASLALVDTSWLTAGDLPPNYWDH